MSRKAKDIMLIALNIKMINDAVVVAEWRNDVDMPSTVEAS